MLTIQLLDQTSIRPFVQLADSGLRRHLLRGADNADLRVWGASFWRQPAGVVIVEQKGDEAHLLDLYVLPAYRRSGIGAALLAEAEKQIGEAGVPRMRTLYRCDEHRPAFEALLMKAGWAPLVHRSTIFWVSFQSILRPWVTRFQFRPPYEVFLWSELTEHERAGLLAHGAAGDWYPPTLSPFHRPDDAWDPATSVGLRYNGEVVGWCLTVREEKTVLVEILFVDPPLQRLGRGFMLVAEAIRRKVAGRDDYSYWRVSAENEAMMRWSRKAFDGGLIDEYEEWFSEKTLTR
ncbi:GNAT family N-acetyltransferase [bacterium]|nr:GNAT family N-acetyltransferase [bacterium]